MGHGRIPFGTMPVPLPGLNMHDIADGHFTFFVLRGDDAGPGRDDQNLVTGMRMPPRRSALIKVHYATAIVRGVPIRDDGLPRPADRSPAPALNGGGCAHGFFLQVVDCHYTHGYSLLLISMRNLRTWRVCSTLSLATAGATQNCACARVRSRGYGQEGARARLAPRTLRAHTACRTCWMTRRSSAAV